MKTAFFNMKTAFFKKWAVPVLIFFIFVILIQLTVNTLVNGFEP